MIIAIGGVSRAGKSTLARLLREKFELMDQSVAIVEQDKYVHHEDGIPKIKNRTDWETPESIDFKEFKKAIHTASKDYDHVIAEGLLVYFDKKLTTKFDISIFIEIPKKLFIKRKEVDLRWGSQPEPKWYIEHIWKSYKRYGIQHVPKDCIKLTGKVKFDLENIMNQILGITQESLLFEEIANRLVANHKHVKRGPMMSSPGIRYKQKNFAFFHNNEMTFKLGKGFDAKSNGITTIRHLNPFKTKPPLKSWYIIGGVQRKLWHDMADLALVYIQKELG